MSHVLVDSTTVAHNAKKAARITFLVRHLSIQLCYMELKFSFHAFIAQNTHLEDYQDESLTGFTHGCCCAHSGKT